ncbi:hypothetical protein [Streptomyces sp. SID13726]|uniref:hypothetical protein n=1 Tax=Streptomyces sp. SID13726 TaxID=2706058 RepID=UPI0013BC68EE|nr:hypothetical protein [Streptomyces sp. SID13726]NEB03625.1 hypothetical protein [Streptomyces sp. SID13726]
MDGVRAARAGEGWTMAHGDGALLGGARGRTPSAAPVAGAASGSGLPVPCAGGAV